MYTKNKLKIIICLILFNLSQAYAIETVIQARVDGFFDDNVNASSIDPRSDWFTNMMLGLSLKSERRELDFNLSGNVYQRLYLEQTENNANYQDIILSINKSFTETLSIKITDSFQHYPDPDNFGTMFSRSNTSAGYKINIFSIGLNSNITKELFFDIGYKNSITKNDNSELIDSTLHSPGGNIGYFFNSANILRVGYLHSLTQYTNDTKNSGNSGYAEYEKYITKQTRIIFQGGYDYIIMLEGKNSSTRWKVSIIDDVDKINQLNITYTKENAISTISNDVFKTWNISLSLKRVLTNRIRTDISFFYGQGHFVINKNENDLLGSSIKFIFIINDSINLNIGYTHTWNSTDSPINEETSYHKNQVSCGLSAIY